MAQPKGKIKHTYILDVMRQHQGFKRTEVKYADIPNPDYDPAAGDPVSMRTKKVMLRTFVANDGYEITVIDNEEQSSPVGPDPGLPGAQDQIQSVYDFVSEGDPTDAKQDGRSPEKKEEDSEAAREARWNRDNGPNNTNIPVEERRGSGLYETHAERARREEQERKSREDQEDRRRRTQADEERNRLDRERLDLERNRDIRRAEEEDRRSQNDSSRVQIERDRLTLEQTRANRPEIVSRPTDEDEQIAVFNPATGQVEAQDNPLYNQAKTEAKRKQEDLALAIQHNQMTAQQAAAEYTRWFKENVELPFTQAAERRAQAAEKRQALEAEERRRQFQAQYKLDRAKLGQDAAEMMVSAETAMLPHRAGPQFGEQMSAAVNSLAAGGKMDGPAANAGINFTADAFEYKKPNLSKIAQKATAAALKNLTGYKPLDANFDVANYEGINMPSATTLHSAPTAPNFVDTGSMFNDWQNTRYPGPSS